MLALLITLLLGGGAVAYTAVPLLHRGPAPDDGEPEVDVLRERQEAAVAALRELDYERQIGKLSDRDYVPLRERYARQAMALLKLLDQRESARERALERAIAARRGLPVPPTGGRPLPPEARRTTLNGARSPADGRRGFRPVIFATGAAMLALIVAVGLLASTVQRGSGAVSPIGQVPLPAPRALAYDPAAPDRLVAADAGALVESRDGGRTWSPLGSTPDGGVLAIFPAADGQGLAALDASGALLRSNDGGRTWSAQAHAPPLPRGAVALATVPGQPPLLFAADAAGVEASADAGASWSAANGFVNGLLPTRDVRDLAYAPTADRASGPNGREFRGLLLAATDRGLYASRDGGQSWLARPLGRPLVAVAVDPRRPSVILALDEQSRLFKSQDAGADWGRG